MRLEKSGKSQGKSHKILENWGNFRQMLFVIFQWQLNEFVYYLLNLIKCSVKKTITEKNTGKWEKILENGKKYWKSQGKVREFCQSGKVGTLVWGLIEFKPFKVKGVSQRAVKRTLPSYPDAIYTRNWVRHTLSRGGLTHRHRQSVGEEEQ